MEIEEKFQKNLALTEKAIGSIKFAPPEGTENRKSAELILNMAKDYVSDAKHFAEKKEMLTALSAVSYAHGWLDCGARLGFFDVDHNSDLFTVD